MNMTVHHAQRVSYPVPTAVNVPERARFGYITLSQCGENRFSYLEPSVHMHVIKREKSRKEDVYQI